ncbi:tRNA pseudouridine(13) synthase TruD [Nitrosopumilus sp. b1]|uniref:tRNA pseudouridine(13) synthase TruD n=1 Tax=Nitrosopumilus sp. b1 TaxID=2109907 RepID=UPI0015F3A0C1|nr:tRNA pseudouridine(13) synthase TruD [Nitrosopumilus sp. b1]KAF6243674.1 tRNA pseudouridine(13) synthase TruD [Nitrosopumilus sp. b1]
MIPKIDSHIGIFVYSTKFPGCGGKIKQKPEDFHVYEVISKKSESQIKYDSGFAVFKLKKQGIDTNHALNSIQRLTGLRLKALGLKDANAVTEQYVISLKSMSTAKPFESSKFTLTPIGYSKKPLSKKDMIGNKFKIKISHANSSLTDFDEYDKILNFYGYQRFGSTRPVTHLIGKAIIQNDWPSAVDYILSYESEYDSKENSEIRNKLKDTKNLASVENQVPPQMDLERLVISELIKHNDPHSAVRALPVNMKRFYVQAYQSYLFNQTLSVAFDSGEDLFGIHENDVCYDSNGILGKFNKGLDQKLAIPQVGYSYYKKTRFDFHIQKILKDEEVTPKNFYIKELQEASNEGGFRNSSITCDDYSVNGDAIEFTLSRGSFATIILREIIKPKEPLMDGF